MEVKKWNLDPSSELYDELVAEDEKVLFKNIDLNNYAILTKASLFKFPPFNTRYQVPGISLQLYVVNAGSGRVLFNKRQRLVDFTRPINMLFDENTVIVSYYNIQVINLIILTLLTVLFVNRASTPSCGSSSSIRLKSKAISWRCNSFRQSIPLFVAVQHREEFTRKAG